MFSVLLVDDESNFRELVRLHIHKQIGAVKIYEAANPIEGLELFEKYKDTIGYVFCDFYLPIQNGNDFTEMIKKANPMVKVCLVTGDDFINKEKHAPHIDRVFYKIDGVGPIINFMRAL